MELRHLRYFVATAETAHVGRAALRLRLAQPSLSRQLADLERKIGVALFVRHPRGVRLTPAGAELLGHARELLARAAAAVAHVRRVGGGVRVRVGLVQYGRGQALLRRGVEVYAARFPHADLTWDAAAYRTQPAAVRDGALDIGFYGGPAAPAVDGVVAERLLAESLAGVLLPGDHPLARQPALDAAVALAPDALRGLPFICAPAAVDPVPVVLDALRAGGWYGRVALECDNPGVISTMVACGAGWAVVPASLAQWTPPGTAYHPLATDATPAAFDLYALWREGPPDPLVDSFLDVLRDLSGAAAPLVP